MHFKYILVYLLFTKVLNLTFDQICMIFFVKAAVRNIYLFVALYVWKPGIEVSCRIIFRKKILIRVVIRCSGTAPARINLMFWGECVVVSHCTSVDIYCLCLGIYDPNKNFHRILPSEQVSNKSATFVLTNWGKKHYNKLRYQWWLNLKIS